MRRNLSHFWHKSCYLWLGSSHAAIVHCRLFSANNRPQYMALSATFLIMLQIALLLANINTAGSVEFVVSFYPDHNLSTYASSCSKLIYMRNPINGATSRSAHSMYSSLVPRFALLQHPPHPISVHSRRINFFCNNSSVPGVYMNDLITLSLDALHETVVKGSETFTQPIVLWIKVSDV
jgi:hypothetical protein